MIALDGVSKTYRKDAALIRALDDVSLEIERGAFVAVEGPSGSGKSTLMHILGLLDRPDSGAVRLGGVDVSSLAPDRLAEVRNERIGFVFQSFHLIPGASALENVELPLVYSRRADIAGLGVQALRRVGLEDRASHTPGELSGGQQQRVAIARALVNEPGLILADEPTGNLDTDSGLEIMAILRELNAQGKTVVLITHDPGIAGMARRRVRLVDGRIVGDRAARSPAAARTAASVDRT